MHKLESFKRSGSEQKQFKEKMESTSIAHNIRLQPAPGPTWDRLSPSLKTNDRCGENIF